MAHRANGNVLMNRYSYPDHSAVSLNASDLAFAPFLAINEVSITTSRMICGDPHANILS